MISAACPLEEPTQKAPQHLFWAGSAQPSPLGTPCPTSRAQREQIEKEQQEEEKKAMERLQHANELRRQVRENQQKQVQDRIAIFEEGQRLKEEAQKRRERIEGIKKKKIEELRWAGIPFSPATLPVPGEVAWRMWALGKAGAVSLDPDLRLTGAVPLQRGLPQKVMGLNHPGSLETPWQDAEALTGMCLGDG